MISLIAVQLCCFLLTTNAHVEDCIGQQCSEVISIPLLDNMKATLKADLDVSELNKVLHNYIQQEVIKAVKGTFDTQMERAVEQITDNVTRLTQSNVNAVVEKFQDCECQKRFIGFSAYMSDGYVVAHSQSLTQRSTLIFDKTETNTASVYSEKTGVFTAPSSGMYAFTWTICVDSRIKDEDIGEFGTQLIVDGQICGALHADTEKSADDECSTGFIIKNVKNNAYLRNIYAHTGAILSRADRTRTTFSGWKLN
ncbi:heavy metal-binding protein HIP-like [Mytilus edulis]|uniref:heavy metal-binding protein HIP-like n=1 Tax=Mytilus edulis TaxID=6550 RepID=UPI0039EF27C8